MQINIKVQGVEQALKKFDVKKVERAVFSTLNETIKSTKSEASRTIRKERGFKIRKEDLDQRIELTPARIGIARAIITVSKYVAGKKASFSLPYFGAQEARRYSGGVIVKSKKNLDKRQKRSKLGGGVTVQVIRGGKIARFPHAFIAKMKSGHVGVFRNVSETEGLASTGKDKIREIKVITVADMFRGITTKLKNHAQEYFQKRFKSKLDW